MGQDDIMKKIKLLLYNDIELLDLMNLPPKDRILTKFRDKYCVSGLLSSNLSDNTLPVRLVISWLSTKSTSNPNIALRPLCIEVYVQRNIEYTATKNALDRRQDLITKRIKVLLQEKRIEGFKLRATEIGDLTSNSIDYVRSFITFQTKYIF